MQLGEFELIDRIRDDFKSLTGNEAKGIGDDCAIIPQHDGMDTLISTDMLIEGSHFLLDDVSACQLGWKSLAVNLSDIAAMGGQPVASFLSVALPRTMDESWIAGFMQGYRDISGEYGIPLLGGDTTSSPDRLCINVAILGSCPHGKALLRSTAIPGDRICVTGNLGDSAAGLQVILRGLTRSGAAKSLVDRHYLPHPRVSQGIALREMEGIHAMMDISDGIGSDLRHILDESGVCAEIDMGRLPLSEELLALCASHPELDPVELACSGGEDYELLFTASPQAEISIPHTVIGRIVEGKGSAIEWLGSDRDYTGFRHF